MRKAAHWLLFAVVTASLVLAGYEALDNERRDQRSIDQRAAIFDRLRVIEAKLGIETVEATPP